MRKALVFVVLSLALLATAGVAAAVRSSSTGSGGVVISSATVGKLGPILVNSKGLTLYMFVPDKAKKVTCSPTCQVVWPPVKVAAGETIVAKGQVNAKLLGSDANPSGGRVVTYDGWPLYTYVSDTGPGTANGQGLNLNGGLWYVLSPSGKVIKTAT